MEETPVKICFVLPEAYPYFNPEAGQMTGGAEFQFYLLATELAKTAQYKVTFIVGDYRQPKVESIKNVRLVRSFNAKRNDNLFKKLKQALQFLVVLRKAKPAVILSTTNNTLVVLCSLYSIFSQAKHIHRIAHNNDTGFERKNEFGFLAKMYSWGMKKADKVLVQNPEQQGQLLTNFNKQSVLLRNAFPVKEMNESQKTVFYGFQGFKVGNSRTYLSN
ncbi:MAG: glycosyltransferase family 4 protein [Chloroflexia bacterium]|nr:glycosyltransferase family 4 protein [Chloroflexia bacterium]